jgi:hypothetical protein
VHDVLDCYTGGFDANFSEILTEYMAFENAVGKRGVSPAATPLRQPTTPKPKSSPESLPVFKSHIGDTHISDTPSMDQHEILTPTPDEDVKMEEIGTQVEEHDTSLSGDIATPVVSSKTYATAVAQDTTPVSDMKLSDAHERSSSKTSPLRSHVEGLKSELDRSPNQVSTNTKLKRYTGFYPSKPASNYDTATTVWNRICPTNKPNVRAVKTRAKTATQDFVNLVNSRANYKKFSEESSGEPKPNSDWMDVGTNRYVRYHYRREFHEITPQGMLDIQNGSVDAKEAPRGKVCTGSEDKFIPGIFEIVLGNRVYVPEIFRPKEKSVLMMAFRPKGPKEYGRTPFGINALSYGSVDDEKSKLSFCGSKDEPPALIDAPDVCIAWPTLGSLSLGEKDWLKYIAYSFVRTFIESVVFNSEMKFRSYNDQMTFMNVSFSEVEKSKLQER